MAKITTILSDLGNVVVLFDNERTINGLNQLRRAPLHGATMPIDGILFDMKAGLWNLFDRGFVDTNNILGTILAAIGAGGVSLSREEMRKFAELAWKDIFKLNDPVVELWTKLRASGLVLTAVSNVDALRYDAVAEMGVAELFDHMVLSFKEKIIKQDGPGLFARALYRSGCMAEEAVFIDDRQDCLEFADKLGIRTFCYDYRDNKALERELMMLGLPVLQGA